MKRTLSLVLCCVLMLALLAGCGSSSTSTASSSTAASTSSSTDTSTATTTETATTRVLNAALKSDIETYDVHQTTQDYEVPLNVFDRLFELTTVDGVTSLNNSLVTDYTISDDGLVFDFTLRDDAYFSNGTQLTANDVAYTFTRMVALENSEQEYLFENVAGYDEFDYSGNYHDAVLTGITVTDDTHFTITLSTPYAGFLNILASPACSIYSKDAVEAAGDSFGTDPQYCIGSGPYALTDWTRDGSITLDANPNYWGNTPDFGEVIINIVPDANTLDMMYQSGEIDILDLDYLDSAIVAATYETVYADKLITSNRLGTTYLTTNAASEVFSDINARKAVAMCIDRQTIIDTILNGGGLVVDGIFPKGLVGYSEDNQGWLQYDPEGAAALLEANGYTKDANGYYFTFTIANDENNSTTRQNVIYAIAEQLKAAGIDCEVQNYDHSSWLDLRRAGEIESYVSTWTADYNDPDNFISTFFGSESSTTGRSVGYANTDVMERVSAAPSIIDENERLAEYADLEKTIVEEDAGWVPLYQQTHIFALSDNVSTWTPHWAGYGDQQFIYAVAAN